MDSGQIDALIESKQKRTTRGGTYEEPETSPEPTQDDDDYGGPSSIRKKTRKGKARDTGDARPSPIPLKRKRNAGGKSMSVTPSIADNDDDIPDTASSIRIIRILGILIIA